MRNEWNLDPTLIHLNHAAVGPWPIRTKKAICAFAEENAKQGSLNYLHWMKVEAELRQNLAALINAPDPDCIALLKNTSEALSIVAYGVDFNAGDNIVISDQEFPSNRIVWDSLNFKEVSLKEVDLNSAETPEDALINACDANTRLLSISSVQYGNGLRIDLRKLGEHCKKNDILFCVDAIQSVGAEQIDVEICHIDFLAADGHKWMLAPEGLALFYCRKALIPTLKLHQFGWHMVSDMGNYNRKTWQAAESARRFECGSPNMLGIHALNASISLLLEVGLQNVEQKIRQKINYLSCELQQLLHIEITTPTDDHRRLGILSFQSKKIASETLFKTLTEQNVFCALRSGAVRLSPHYYTPEQQLNTVIQLITEL